MSHHDDRPAELFPLHCGNHEPHKPHTQESGGRRAVCSGKATPLQTETMGPVEYVPTDADHVHSTTPHPHEDGQLYAAKIDAGGCRPLVVCSAVGGDHRGAHTESGICRRPVPATSPTFHPGPGSRWTDVDGDTWTTEPDGWLRMDNGATTDGGRPVTVSPDALAISCGPLTELRDEHVEAPTVYVGDDGRHHTLPATGILPIAELGVFAPQPGTVWRDRHGDVWTVGEDWLLRTPETMPHVARRVEAKFGPLVRVGVDPELVDDVRLCTPSGHADETVERAFTPTEDELARAAVAQEANVREHLDALLENRLEWATGRNGAKLLADVREYGLDIVLARPTESANPSRAGQG